MNVIDSLLHHPLILKLDIELKKSDYSYQHYDIISKLPDYFKPQGSPCSPSLEFILNEDYLEWIDIVEAVAEAKDRFVMFELGAGFGRWCVNAMIALKFLNPLPYQFVAVEADPSHFKFLNDYFNAFGLNLEDHQLIEAAVDTQKGHAIFNLGDPNQWSGDPNLWYGQNLQANTELNTQGFIKHAIKRILSKLASPTKIKASTHIVDTITLNSILEDYDKIDLIDLDIQGAEFNVLNASIEMLNKKVKRIHVGTHGKEIEKALEDLFNEHGWENKQLYSCFSTCDTPYGRIYFNDGVQTWINPRLK